MAKHELSPPRVHLQMDAYLYLNVILRNNQWKSIHSEVL